MDNVSASKLNETSHPVYGYESFREDCDSDCAP